MTRGLKPSTIVAGSSPVTKIPTPPAALSKEAKAEWRKVAPILVLERRVLTIADLAALATYCMAVGMVSQLDRELQDKGHVLPSGKRNPASTALIQAMQMQLRAASELGLTPAARSRATMIADNDDDDDSPLTVGRGPMRKSAFPHWIYDGSPIDDPFGYGEEAVEFLRKLKHPNSTGPKGAFQLYPFQERIVRRIMGRATRTVRASSTACFG